MLLGRPDALMAGIHRLCTQQQTFLPPSIHLWFVVSLKCWTCSYFPTLAWYKKNPIAAVATKQIPVAQRSHMTPTLTSWSWPAPS